MNKNDILEIIIETSKQVSGKKPPMFASALETSFYKSGVADLANELAKKIGAINENS